MAAGRSSAARAIDSSAAPRSESEHGRDVEARGLADGAPPPIAASATGTAGPRPKL